MDKVTNIQLDHFVVDMLFPLLIKCEFYITRPNLFRSVDESK